MLRGLGAKLLVERVAFGAAPWSVPWVEQCWPIGSWRRVGWLLLWLSLHSGTVGDARPGGAASVGYILYVQYVTQGPDCHVGFGMPCWSFQGVGLWCHALLFFLDG